ncbi:MAG: hypothetical protein RLZZ502_1916 [Pseudomonadota bacterium]|jgi:AcrR family transcriptional regulator
MPYENLGHANLPTLNHSPALGDSTQERILSAAEALYVTQGFDGTSLRAITKLAGVNLAAVNYHFGNKEGLIRTLLTRRLDPLNSIRLERLNAYTRSDVVPTAEILLQIMFLPALELAKSASPTGFNFLRLLGRAYSDPSPYTQALLSNHYATAIVQFKDAFAKAIPHVPAAELKLRLHFTMTALSTTLANHDLLRLMAPLRNKKSKTETDENIVLNQLIPFLVAGLVTPSVAL